MIEAFEIGVSLALQDGVSNAIGMARRDVAALEHAVRESGVSLRSLRDAGTKVSSVAFGEQPRATTTEPAKRVASHTGPLAHDDMAAAPTGVMSGMAQPLALPMGVGAQQMFGQAPDVGKHASDVANFFGGVPAERAAESRDDDHGQFVVSPTPAAPADNLLDAAVVPAAALAPVAAQQAGPDVGARVPLETMARLAQLASPAAGRASLSDEADQLPASPSARRKDVQEIAGQVSLVSALRLSGGSVAMTGRDDNLAADGDGPAMSTGDESGAQMPQAPGFAGRVQQGAPQAQAAARSGDSQTMSPQTASRDAGPNEGDVFLDGMLVGRWMSRFMNREAERASAGPTGFDARRGRLLPGVTVGG